MAALADLLSTTYAPIQVLILSYLEIADVISLSRTSRDLDLWSIIEAISHNINHQLRGFFSSPQLFQSIQASCEALITGLSARLFIMGRLTDHRTMKLLVHNDKWPKMRLYLQEEGYEAKQTTSKKSRFVKSTLDINHTVIVDHDVKSVVGRDISAPLTTAGLNSITWNKAYSLFPFTTFIQRRSFALTSFSERLNDVFARQHNDSFRTLSVDWFQSGSNRMMRSRRIGDKYTWIIDLDTTGINKTPRPDKFIESTTFCLQQGSTADSNVGGTVPLAHYKMGQLGILDHPVLRRGYNFLYDEDTQPRREYEKKISDLTKRLDETTIIELGKITRSQRPPQYDLIRAGQATAAASRGLFALPTTWVFCDNDLIGYLDRA